MQAQSVNTIDLLIIDCSAYTKMDIRWARYTSDNTILQYASHSIFTQSVKQSRAEKLPSICEQLRIQCDGDYARLHAICINIGPGSFTGTRASLAFAKGICCGNSHIRLITTTTFDIIAEAYTQYRPLLVTCDARNKKYFYTLYDNDTVSNSMVEELNYPALQTKINTSLQENGTLYIAGDKAHDIYTQYYHNTHECNKNLLLPYNDWNTINTIQTLSDIGIQKWHTNDFSPLNCTPLYVKTAIS